MCGIHSLALGRSLLPPETAPRGVPSHLPEWVGDSTSDLASKFPEDWGAGRSQLQEMYQCRSPVATRGGPWARRVAPGVSDKGRDGGGGGNPRMSQPVPEKGARFQCSAEPGTPRSPRHACLHLRPITGLEGKEEVPEPRSHRSFASRTKPRPRGGTRRKPTTQGNRGRKLDAQAVGICPPVGPRPLTWRLCSPWHL